MEWDLQDMDKFNNADSRSGKETLVPAVVLQYFILYTVRVFII